jgi:hypothetical protein
MAELRPGGPNRDPANGSSVPAGYYWARQRLFAGFKFAREMGVAGWHKNLGRNFFTRSGKTGGFFAHLPTGRILLACRVL